MQQQQEVPIEHSRSNSTSSTTMHETQVSAVENALPSLESHPASALDRHSVDPESDAQSFPLVEQMMFDPQGYGRLLTSDGDDSMGLEEVGINVEDVESEMHGASTENFFHSWEPFFDSFSEDALAGSNDTVMDEREAEPLLFLSGSNQPPKSIISYPKTLHSNRDQIFEENSTLVINSPAVISRPFLTPTSTPMRTPASGYAQGVMIDSSTLPAINEVCTAECYSSMVKKLLYIEESLPGIATCDTILELEEAMQSLKGRIMNCAICFKRQSTLLMLVLIVERTVHLFERKYGREEGSYGQRKSVATQRTNRGIGKKRTRRESLERNVEVRVIDECSLLVGCFEVKHGPKVKFLKSLVKMRLRRLCILSSDIQDAVNMAPEDCNTKAAQEMTRDIIKRLLSLTGRVEFWE